jgi:peptidoglycan/LPS O-acetylase OafA/YrhL
MEKTTPPPQRLASLDLLRAIALLLVLGRHMPEVPAGAVPGPVAAFLDLWSRGGWVGVDLFFVLSGFLVSGLLFREYDRHGAIRPGRFLARRGFKIYPAFYVMLAIVLCIAAWNGRALPRPAILWTEVLFVQNYGPALFQHTWSLAVEEHFYLVLPFLLLALSRGKGAPFAALPAVFGFVAIFCLAGRIATSQSLDTFTFKTHLFPTHLRMDSLLFGALLAWLWQYHGDALRAFVQRHRWPLAAAAAVLAAPPFLHEVGAAGFYMHTAGLTALYLSSGIILLLALRLRSAWTPLARLGAHSYSIYLWHFPVKFYVGMLLPRDLPPAAHLAAYFLASIVVGVAAAKLIETPFLALRDRILPSRSGRNGDTPAAVEPMPVTGAAATA